MDVLHHYLERKWKRLISIRTYKMYMYACMLRTASYLVILSYCVHEAAIALL